MFAITAYFISGLDYVDWPDYKFLKRLTIWIIFVHIFFSKEYQTASVLFIPNWPRLFIPERHQEALHPGYHPGFLMSESSMKVSLCKSAVHLLPIVFEWVKWLVYNMFNVLWILPPDSLQVLCNYIPWKQMLLIFSLSVL